MAWTSKIWFLTVLETRHPGLQVCFSWSLSPWLALGCLLTMFSCGHASVYVLVSSSCKDTSYIGLGLTIWPPFTLVTSLTCEFEGGGHSSVFNRSPFFPSARCPLPRRSHPLLVFVFIYLAVLGLSCSMWTLSRGMWDQWLNRTVCFGSSALPGKSSSIHFASVC